MKPRGRIRPEPSKIMSESETPDLPPDLSVVLTVVDSGAVLERCLESLANQNGNPSIEALVPYDHITPEVGEIGKRFPQFTFIDMGTILDGLQPIDPLKTNLFFDARRTVALKAAKGRLLGIIEDRGIPAPDWCRNMIALHDEHPHAAIGGAVENSVDHAKNWAIYFCDFSRYQPPLAIDNPEYVTDTNMAYKREPLMEVRHIWDESYLEAPVNWELRRRGYKLLLSDKAVTVQHRVPGGLSTLLGERYHWARMFGQIRGREVGTAERTKLTLAMPLLPFLQLFRQFRRQQEKGHHMRQFPTTAPLTFLLLLAWSVGELVGYTQARADQSQ